MTRMPRIRLLPATATALVALLALKSADLFLGIGALAGFSSANAATDADPNAPATTEPEGIAPLADPASMSASEIQVLQSLAQRRAKLDTRERELDMQAKLLDAVEQRVSERVTELKIIEARITEMLGARDAEAEKQILALVKVYETMKPGDAARIFETLDDSVLMDVAPRLKPAKLAAILAAMKPEFAQALTVKLVRRFDMPETAMLTPTETTPAIVPELSVVALPAAASETVPAAESVADPITEPVATTEPVSNPEPAATTKPAPASEESLIPTSIPIPVPPASDAALVTPTPAPVAETVVQPPVTEPHMPATDESRATAATRAPTGLLTAPATERPPVTTVPSSDETSTQPVAQEPPPYSR